jgi:hypothetical protein
VANTVDYELEDKLYPLLPQVLIKDFGVRIEGELERKFIEYPDESYEVKRGAKNN